MTTDLPAAVREIFAGRISVSSYFRSLRAPLEHAVLAADDPLPFLLEVPMLSIDRLGQRLQEFRRGATARTGEAVPTTITPATDNNKPLL